MRETHRFFHFPILHFSLSISHFTLPSSLLAPKTVRCTHPYRHTPSLRGSLGGRGNLVCAKDLRYREIMNRELWHSRPRRCLLRCGTGAPAGQSWNNTRALRTGKIKRPDTLLAPGLRGRRNAIYGADQPHCTTEIAALPGRQKKRPDTLGYQASAEGETPHVALTNPIVPQDPHIGKSWCKIT